MRPVRRTDPPKSSEIVLENEIAVVIHGIRESKNGRGGDLANRTGELPLVADANAESADQSTGGTRRDRDVAEQKIAGPGTSLPIAEQSR